MVLAPTLSEGTGAAELSKAVATASGRSWRWRGHTGHPRPPHSYLAIARASLAYPGLDHSIRWSQGVAEKAGHVRLEWYGGAPWRHSHVSYGMKVAEVR